MKIRATVFLLALLLCLSAEGRKKKVARVRLSPQEQLLKEKMDQMMQQTQQVVIIDSMVVDKAHFLNFYHLSSDAGTIQQATKFSSQKEAANDVAYVNEVGTKCFLPIHETDSTSNLYLIEMDNYGRSKPILQQGINDGNRFSLVNYPFMMGDGQTLYFSAIGDEGLGGYDIYQTTYDEETGRFLHPAHMGLPFNSEGNDYMYCIDEYNQLGWFATDRRQPEGKVCIYVFLPSAVRRNYDANDYSPQALESLATIHSIADTWTDEDLLREGCQRLEAARQEPKTEAVATTGRVDIVINDQLVYHHPSELRAPSNAPRYQRLVTYQNALQQLRLSLDKARNYYTIATPDERVALAADINKSEREVLQIQTTIHQLEKELRNIENHFLTNQH
jgi:hypothetical protein